MLLWLFLHFQCFLSGCLDRSLALPSAVHPHTVMSTAGSTVVLPCSWKDRLDVAGESPRHIQWVAPPHMVFERRGDAKWQAPKFEGRLEIPQENLESGDCSLVIEDVRFTDAHEYESFMVVEAVDSKRTRVFIRSVKLAVTDHKSKQSRRPGEDLVLELRTPYSQMVVFFCRSCFEWSLLWMRGNETAGRVRKDAHGEQVIVNNLTRSDEGYYKVLDEEGLSVSTVELFVEEREHVMLQKSRRDHAVRGSCSRVYVPTFLLLNALILPLL